MRKLEGNDKLSRAVCFFKANCCALYKNLRNMEPWSFQEYAVYCGCLYQCESLKETANFVWTSNPRADGRWIQDAVQDLGNESAPYTAAPIHLRDELTYKMQSQPSGTNPELGLHRTIGIHFISTLTDVICTFPSNLYISHNNTP